MYSTNPVLHVLSPRLTSCSAAAPGVERSDSLVYPNASIGFMALHWVVGRGQRGQHASDGMTASVQMAGHGNDDRADRYGSVCLRACWLLNEGQSPADERRTVVGVCATASRESFIIVVNATSHVGQKATRNMAICPTARPSAADACPLRARAGGTNPARRAWHRTKNGIPVRSECPHVSLRRALRRVSCEPH